jgi:tetratricopeptide (TPR) repeat protein
MAFEKAKVIKAAEKFLSQGKISAAIKEYRQIMQHDPDDLTTLNMLGDLLARSGEKDEAAICFLRIAEHYRDREFRLKAIAMYRKVEKLKPRDPVIARQLGDLYAAHGLIADARAQYLVVADASTRSGQTRDTLKVLHTIADLDPQNTDVRLKLAEGYLKEGMDVEAGMAFGEAAARLLERGRHEKALDAYSKALGLRPNDRETLKGVVSAHVGLGTADDAAELLETAVAGMPDDPELKSMLAQAYIEAEDADGAERATALLMSQDASHYRRYIEVARLYLRLNQEDQTARVLGVIIEPMLAGREENDLSALIDELLARNPDHVPSLKLLGRLHWWQRDMDKLRGVLERLAEAAEALGLADDERYALTQLVRLAPEDSHYLERLTVLGGSLEEINESASAADDLPPLPEFEGVRAFDSANGETGSTTGFEWNAVADEPATAAFSFADLNEPDIQSGEAVDDSAATDPFAVEPADDSQPPAGEKPVSAEAMMRQELESVDFYLLQGYYDIATDTLDLLERQLGPHAEIAARRTKLAAANPPVAAEIFAPVVEDAAVEAAGGPAVDVVFGEVEFESMTSNAAPVPASGIDSGLAEIFEEFRAEAEGEGASTNEDYETHFNMATAYKEMDLLDEAIREFQTAASLTLPADGTSRYFHCCNLLGHCFMQKGMPQAAVLWFKKGLHVPGRNAEELKALQYELGSAYEQMGDVTGAVAAFTEVYGVDVGYRDIGERLTSLQSSAGREPAKRK